MKLLTQQPTEFSPEINAIFDDEFFKSIGLDPVPVLFMKKQAGEWWGGFCSSNEYTESGEVVIERELIQRTVMPAVNAKSIRHIYIHEMCHRLLPNEAHSIRFFCLNLLLQIRAAKQSGEDFYFESCNFYDIQDCKFEDLPYAFLLIFKFANKNESLNHSAKELAKLIMTELTDEALRKIKYEQNHQVPELRKQVEELISQINLQRFKYFCFGMASTLFCALAVKFVAV